MKKIVQQRRLTHTHSAHHYHLHCPLISSFRRSISYGFPEVAHVAIFESDVIVVVDEVSALRCSFCFKGEGGEEPFFRVHHPSWTRKG